MNERRVWTGWIALLAMVLLVGIGFVAGRDRGEPKKLSLASVPSKLEEQRSTFNVERTAAAAAAKKARKLPTGFVLPAGNTLAGIVYRVGEPDELDSTEFDEPRPPLVTKWITYERARVRLIFRPERIDRDFNPIGEWTLVAGAIDPETKQPLDFDEAMRRLAAADFYSEFPGDAANAPGPGADGRDDDFLVMARGRFADNKYIVKVGNRTRESAWGVRVAVWSTQRPRSVREFVIGRLKPGETIERVFDATPLPRHLWEKDSPDAKVIFAPFTTSAAGSVAVPERRYAPALLTPAKSGRCAGAPDCTACRSCDACAWCADMGGTCGVNGGEKR